jgi:glycosyltransferase involved in cell wall biosynthesis
MNKRLAIIIPAYKAAFFHETLKSIKSQTCQKFTLYIGDDASPNNIFEIVEQYGKDIDIVYKRFDENLGSKDLIAQWNRCIEMSFDEEWLWLFSDDDVMSSNCVELFYKHIESDKQSQLLHFNVDIINGEGKLSAKGDPFPLNMTSVDFFEKRMGSQIFSFAVEYVFTRKLYLDEGKFQVFDLAWCSDDATWVKFAKNKGITTIAKKPLVHWRSSGQNISSLNIDEAILFRKLNAKKAYLKWALQFFKMNNKALDITRINIVKWILSDINQVSYLTFIKRGKIAYKYAKITGTFIDGLIGVIYVSYYELKQLIKQERL